MAEWEIVGFEGESPRIGQQGVNVFSGLRYGPKSSLVLDAGIVYANANIEELSAYPRTLTAALNTWTDSDGNLVQPQLLGETRSILYGNGLCPKTRG